MEELELLKKDWNKQSDELKNYSENEIHQMIKHKSVSVTKTLLIIGITEIVLWAVYGYFDGEFPYIRMGLFGIFFGLIIYLYCKIKAGEDSVSLMEGILNLRKVIVGYAGISFLLIVVDNLINFKHNVKDFMAGFRDGSKFNTYHKTNADTLTPELVNYIVFAIAVIITMYLIYLVYKKTYGRILSNLRKNYRELSHT
ncbi:hypothetical protein ACQWU4_06885 [Chryseobacterium sp. MIQD13]|uniref:hypothetical protein n=1 Tax=Chryseobacterium sp. MIQD13 TaxID=3422310 RepID=UPI003D27B1CE